MKRITLTAVALSAAVAVAGPASAKFNRVAVGTNPAGTMYNTLGGGFAKIIQEKLSIQSVARPFAGSSVYLPMLQRGEIQFGLNSSLDSSLAYTGGPPYNAKMTNLRAVASVWPLPYQFIVKASSGMTKIEDLKGKSVITNYKANVSLNSLIKAILATGGLSEADVKPVQVGGLPQGMQAVVEGRADAVPIAPSIALVRQADSTVQGGLRVLNMGTKEDVLPQIRPGSWVGTAKPSPRFVGVKSDTRIAFFATWLNTSAKNKAEDVYDVVKVLHQNWAALQKDYPALRATPADKIVPADNPHPYHEGAIRYYKEAGLWTAAHDAHQTKVMGMK